MKPALFVPINYLGCLPFELHYPACSPPMLVGFHLKNILKFLPNDCF